MRALWNYSNKLLPFLLSASPAHWLSSLTFHVYLMANLILPQYGKHCFLLVIPSGSRMLFFFFFSFMSRRISIFLSFLQRPPYQLGADSCLRLWIHFWPAALSFGRLILLRGLLLRSSVILYLLWWQAACIQILVPLLSKIATSCKLLSCSLPQKSSSSVNWG